MEGIPITELMAQCCDYFREQGRTSNPTRYRRLWENGILPYMQTHGISLYTSDIGKAYLEEIGRAHV